MTCVCVVGSVNIDLTCYLPRWPQQGETIAVPENRKGLGGKGANQAVAAAKMGAQAHMIGAIGDDAFGRYCKEELSAFGVSTHLATLSDQATGMALIDVGPDGNNIIRLSQGANHAWSSQMLERYADTIAGCDVLLLQNEIPLGLSLAAAKTARRAGAFVVMDPAPAPDTPWPSEALQHFDILTPNANEAGLMLGHAPVTLSQAQLAAEELTKLGPKGAIVTMGGNGVAWCIEGAKGQITPPKVAAIDTVGAGDCFNGALAAFLANGMSVAAAIETASVAASLATTQSGAASSMPSASMVNQFMARRAVA